MAKFTDTEWKQYIQEYQPNFDGNPEQLRLLLENGVKGWNQWRSKNSDIKVDLSRINVTFEAMKKNKSFIINEVNESYHMTVPCCKVDLSGINLSNAKIFGANATNARFIGANLEFANLHCAILTESDFAGADLNNANLSECNIQKSRLMSAGIKSANLTMSDFSGSSLWFANFENSDLGFANMQNTNLSHAKLMYTNLAGADLSGANVFRIYYKKETILLGTSIWEQNTIKSFEGISADTCVGNHLFRRYVMDQSYIESIKKRKPPWLYKSIYMLWRLSSNCGQSMLLWLFWSIVFALGFGGLFHLMGPEHFELAVLEFNFQSVIYYSVVTFTTLGFGDIIPKTNIAAWCVMAEVLLGYIMLGGLISIFATKLARRN